MKRSTSWFSVLPSLVTPVCLGLVFYIGLQAAIAHQVISDETVLRYLLGHPVSKISVAMFFVGMASLLLIGLDVMQQFRYAKCVHLDREKEGYEPGLEVDGPSESGSQEDRMSASANAAALAELMGALPTACRNHYLWQRLRTILQSIERNGSATHVEQELKYQAELDVEQQYQRYSLVQILIWATPMLGFLGTVLGISQALGGISVGPDNNFQTMMDGLKGSLYVAFDTTALALTLSMLMMFGQFLVDRFESQLLRVVTQQAHAEIANNFDLTETDSTKNVVQNLDGKIIHALESAADRQTELWRESLKWAEKSMLQSVAQTHQLVEKSLADCIENSIDGLARTLDESISRADQSMTHRWEQWQVTFSENARQSEKHQIQFAEETRAVCELLQQTAEAIDRHVTAVSSVNTIKQMEPDIKVNSLPQEPSHGDSATAVGVQQVSNNSRNWISVSPEFLSDPDDHGQVIIPMTTPLSRQAEVKSALRSNTEPVQPQPGKPEVILPFLKKSA